MTRMPTQEASGHESRIDYRALCWKRFLGLGLESAIRCLLDTTFESKDPAEKTRLEATEMRARLVLERFRKGNAN